METVFYITTALVGLMLCFGRVKEASTYQNALVRITGLIMVIGTFCKIIGRW